MLQGSMMQGSAGAHGKRSAWGWETLLSHRYGRVFGWGPCQESCREAIRNLGRQGSATKIQGFQCTPRGDVLYCTSIQVHAHLYSPNILLTLSMSSQEHRLSRHNQCPAEPKKSVISISVWLMQSILLTHYYTRGNAWQSRQHVNVHISDGILLLKFPEGAAVLGESCRKEFVDALEFERSALKWWVAMESSLSFYFVMLSSCWM